ncbi:hypothetical protein [Methylobacterium soli]|uniref:Uncharacterized protein n=1 Tax=Methylobacterium soli TaxID=553447 RepID=A0A6L3T7A2_9HYPH|nr:hypothetical protein [Methylobacterium soli]KAB1079388.1 hypothetical protein F6X53_11335 [Methylobacterium soli]
MATVAKLREGGQIVSIEVELDRRDQPQRMLFGTPGFLEWLTELLGSPDPSPLGLELSPAEQLDALFADYISGAPLNHTRQFRILRPSRSSVWELKTPDLRIFGWFLQRDCFLAVFGAWADRVKDHDLYHGYLNEVARIRQAMGLQEALCITGIDPNDVISI